MHCAHRGLRATVLLMIDRRLVESRALPILCSLILCATATRCHAQGPTAAAVYAYDSYVRAIESRLNVQHRSSSKFLAVAASTPQNQCLLHRGSIVLEQLTPSSGLELPGALLHHWRGTVFLPGATAAAFTRVMQNYSAYPQIFAPQVLRTTVLSRHGNQFQVSMRIRQQHVITVVLDGTYDITFGQLDPLRRYSISRSTQISEVENPGSDQERTLSLSQGHGFLWRQNTYWTCEQTRAGLYIQVESISLTRAIPFGLTWAVGPYVESIPHDSLVFTLRAVSRALQPHQQPQSPERKHA